MCILHQIPSEKKIERKLRKVLFGKKVFCPRCGSFQIKKYEWFQSPYSFLKVSLPALRRPIRQKREISSILSAKFPLPALLNSSTLVPY